MNKLGEFHFIKYKKNGKDFIANAKNGNIQDVSSCRKELCDLIVSNGGKILHQEENSYNDDYDYELEKPSGTHDEFKDLYYANGLSIKVEGESDHEYHDRSFHHRRVRIDDFLMFRGKIEVYIIGPLGQSDRLKERSQILKGLRQI
jgi:hypothetical protein